MQTGIELYIKEKDSYVTASDFIDAAEKFISLLKEIETTVSDNKQPKLKWVVQDLKAGSTAIVLDGISGVHINYTVTDVMSRVIDGLSRLENKEEAPAYFTEDALRYARDLAAKVGKGIASVMVRTAHNEVNLTHNLVANADVILATSTTEEYGSIIGSLKMVTTSGAPYYNVYDSVTSRPVKCEFSITALQSVLSAMIHGFVSVSGKISYDLEGFPKKIKNAEIEMLPLESDLPTTEDILALKLDLSGGLSLGEFMERCHERD